MRRRLGASDPPSAVARATCVGRTGCGYGKPPRRLRRLLRTGLALLPALLCVGAGPARTPVRFEMGWLPQADFGGFYAAEADGLYARAGLDVALLPGSPQNGGLMTLATGAYDFVRISDSGVALGMAAAQLPYVVIAAIYQKDPTVLIAHAAGAPGSLAGLRGRPIMISPEARDTYWAFLQQRYGYQASQIRRYTGNDAIFIADPRLAQQGYLTNDVQRLRREGVPIRQFLLADAGYSAYGTLIAARRSLVEQHPDLVQRFLDASLLGWCHYLHGARAGADALIGRGNPDYTRQGADDAVAAIRSYGLVEGGDAAGAGIGSMSARRWQSYLEQMAPTGLYPRLDLGTVYTTRFLHGLHCAAAPASSGGTP